MNSIELAFFALAILLPLVGGGALLYFIANGNKGNEGKTGNTGNKGDEDAKGK